MLKQEIESYQKAGKIAKQIREYSRQIIKPGILLAEIAEKIENKIEELGGEIAFPVNLCINEIAAHFQPALEDKTKAEGLLKIDIGIHINGMIADTALTIDLTENQEHKELIQSSEEALTQALEILKQNPSLSEIGETIQKAIEEKGFSPIVNLSGHSLDEFEVHSGITIPNYKNNNQNILQEGAYAIEPFATTGEGKIYEGPPGNIYALTTPKNTRSPKAREILEYIMEKHRTLPFSLRQIQKKFGAFSRIHLKELENQDIIKSYNQLIEKSHKPVSQSEHSFIKTPDNKIIVFTRD